MSGSYQKTMDYVTGSFLKEFLRIGDTFHLISFSDTPRLEITRRIQGWGDVETIIGRLFLLYPLDPYSDIAGALAYGEKYVASIPGTRKKKVVLISDGDHNPRPGGTTEDSVQHLISQTTDRLNRAGIDFYHVPVPVVGNGPSSGRSRMLPIPAAAARPTAPPVPPRQPASSQAGPPAAQTTRPAPPQVPPPEPQPGPPAAAQTVRPEPQKAPAPEPRSEPSAAQTAQPDPPQVPPPEPQPGPPAAPAPEPRQPETEAPAPSPKVTDQEPSPGKTTPRYQGGDISLFGLPLSWFIGGILGIILIFTFIIFLMAKRLQTSPNRTFAHAVDSPPKKTVPAKKPEPPEDDGARQNQNLPAPYPESRHRSEEKQPGAGLEALFLKRNLPAETIVKTEAAAPIPPSGSEGSPDKGDMAGPVKTPGASPKTPWLTREAGTVPKTEAAGTPIPLSGPKGSPDKGGAAMAPGRPINYGAHRSITPVKSYKNNTQSHTGPLMLSLFVEDQNTNIGRRNIHTVKSGYSFTIGGGKSDFLIFLVPIPPRIAEVRSDGVQCTFIPRRPEFFPDLGSQQVPNCVGVPIRVISERQYELFIRIDRYEDPLIALNRLLHSIEVPGPGYWQEPG
ncbi:hypothetical protein LQZ21_03000 [Treponema sp. TIM-1]